MKTSTATILTGLGIDSGAEFFVSATDGREFATFTGSGHRETWAIRSKAFRSWLGRLYFEQTHEAPSTDALASALGVLEGVARYEGTVEDVHVRLARLDDTIYFDLGDPDWQVIAITANGWAVDPAPPVRFRRPGGYGRLPVPVRIRAIGGAGPLDELRGFINATDDGFHLIVGWAVGALNPDQPFPILCLYGEQGSAKSTTTRLLRLLLDPNVSPLRSLPRDERDLAIAATNAWVASFDNVSGVKPWISDALCRVATGGGVATRRLYTDDEEAVFDGRRPVILNGIDDVATRSDLLDRAIVVELPRVTERQRRSERELFVEFGGARPRLLGAMLTAASTALRRVGSFTLAQPPRMADFAHWVEAAAPALDWPAESFVTAYRVNRRQAHEIVLDVSPIVAPLRKVLDERQGEWVGTAAELLELLVMNVDERTTRSEEWPKTPRKLSGDLRRLAPNLRAVDVNVTFTVAGHDKRRMVSLRKGDDNTDRTDRTDRPSVADADDADDAVGIDRNGGSPLLFDEGYGPGAYDGLEESA